jgi:HEAT repeat protein
MKRNIVTSVILLALGVTYCAIPRGPSVVAGKGQDLKKFNQFVQASNSPSIRLLREGRDLIDGERWSDAASKFSQFLADYPKDKDVDVALYWLAYSLKQQGKFREASLNLERLLRDRPASTWAEEAIAMRAEIAPQTGDTQVIDEALKKNDEEIKIVALQSLFESNPARALVYVQQILKPNSSASRSFKESALSLVASHGGRESLPLLLEVARTQSESELRATAIHGIADQGGAAALDDLIRLYEAERENEVKRHILSTFENIEAARADAKLLEIARATNEHIELRKTAIHTLANKKGSAAVEALLQIYSSDSNREIREQALISLAETKDARARAKLLDVARDGTGDRELRKFAIERLGDMEGGDSFEELMKIYQSERDTEVRAQVLEALGNMDNTRARARVAELARSEPDAELRKVAIRVMAEDDENPQTVEMLIGMYDAEKDEEVKSEILDALAETEQKRALQKVMDVARRDANQELRKKAVSLLGQWDDPEAAKFLEELLKP